MNPQSIVALIAFLLLVGFIIWIGVGSNKYQKRKATEPPPRHTINPEPDQYKELLNQGKCPFCRGEVETGALKCKHCGEWIEPTHRAKSEAQNAKVQQSQLATGALAKFVGALIILSVLGYLLRSC